MHRLFFPIRLLCLLLVLSTGVGRLAAQSYPHTYSLQDALQHPKYEVRAAWLATLKGLDWPTTQATSPKAMRRQQQELCQMLDELQRTGINTVIFQTRLRDNVVYESTLQPWADCLTGTPGKHPGYDPLAFAIDECHKRGMELHAWVVAIPLGDDRQVKQVGRRSTTRQHPEMCIHYQRAWYLNPGHPKTPDYLAAIVREIVSRYDVDGINLDYIRYPDRPQRFPDQATYRKYGKGLTLAQWRRNNITRIVRRIYTEVKSLKPWVKVSSSPLGKHADVSRYSARGWNAYHTVFQEAQQWMDEGIHDQLFPMLYFRDANYYPFVLDWQEHSHGRMAVPGLGIYFLDPREGNWQLKDVMQQMYFTRAAQVSGQAYFRTRFLLDNTQGLLDTLRTHVYKYPALVPPLTWCDSVPPTAPTRLQTTVQGDSLLIRWDAVSDDTDAVHPGMPAVRYNLYMASAVPVDIHRPEHLHAAYLRSTHYTVPLKEAQGKHFAVTAVDAYGNESEAQASPRTNVRIQPAAQPIDLPDHATAVQVIVTDLYDRIVWQELYTSRLDINRFAPGFYYIKAKEKNGSIRPIGHFTR